MSMHIEHMTRAFEDAHQGGRVAIFAESLDVARHIFNDIADCIPGYVSAEVRKTNGAQRIDFTSSGGSIYFRSIRSNSRGLSVDRAYVPIGTDHDKLAEVIPMLATSKDGLLTGY